MTLFGTRRWCTAALVVAATVASACPEREAAAADDVITPVVATAITPPAQVLGADGLRHFAYELELVNPAPFAVTIRRIDALARGRVVDTLSGQDLTRHMSRFGATRPGRTLAAGQAGVVIMHVSMRRRAVVPRSLVHRLTIRLAQPDPRVATTYHTARTRVVRRPAIVVAPPLRGDRWVVGNGCCEAANAHRSAVLAINGGFFVAERFAIDFVQLDAQGKAFEGPGNLVSSYPFYGVDVLSATTGRVVRVVNDMPDTPPGALPEGITAAQAGGNYVVVDMGGGRYAFYAHFAPGSVVVKPGDRVAVGQVLGRLGTSGNSDLPHLHFHVMDGASPLGSNGLPYTFTAFRSEGTLTNLAAVEGGAPATIGPALRGSYGRRLPLDLQVIDFG